MDTAAQIRNFLVHTRRGHEFVAAVPHEDTVQRVEYIAGVLVKPKLVIPTFQNQVITFNPDQRLTDLLAAVDKEQVTFFPIIDGTGFQGLVTGTGLMRWLAQLAETDPITDLSEIPIGDILEQEELRANHVFVGRNTPAYEAFDLFGQIAGLAFDSP